MLGPDLGQEQGRIIGQRVLDAEGPKIESTFSAEGTYRLIVVTDLGTYWTIPRTGGALYGEGQGLLTTTDGQFATWTARGLGRFTAPRTIWFRGSTFYQTDSTGSLAFINNLMAVFEFEVNGVGNTSARNWEWVY
jgi:hypothetical protein